MLVEKESTAETSDKIDRANISTRKYRMLKGPHQCAEAKVAAQRKTLNQEAGSISTLLSKLLQKCTCTERARVKVSVDGHDPTKNTQAVTFSFSLVCEPAAQSSQYLLPTVSQS